MSNQILFKKKKKFKKIWSSRQKNLKTRKMIYKIKLNSLFKKKMNKHNLFLQRSKEIKKKKDHLKNRTHRYQKVASLIFYNYKIHL